LRPGGVSIDVGVGPEPIEITSSDLIFGERKLAGSLTGNPATGDATLRFSALTGVSAMIETVPLQGSRSRLREDDGREGAVSNGPGHEQRREQQAYKVKREQLGVETAVLSVCRSPAVRPSSLSSWRLSSCDD